MTDTRQLASVVVLPVATAIENFEDLSVDEVLEEFDVSPDFLNPLPVTEDRSLNITAPPV
jgi:hypothetical protein